MPEATRNTVFGRSRRQRPPFLPHGLFPLCFAAGLLLVTGCASTGFHDVVHFKPAPPERVGACELEPVEPVGMPADGRVFSPVVIPEPLPGPVLAEVDELCNGYPKTFQRGLDRASKYEAELRRRFREAGLPEDLVWLAMVESMFQPKVNSPAGAGGMWQFMPATGRRYNLRMDSYVDERYNVSKSTTAAIEYLKYLHDYFEGSWELAITAYNMGEGGLSRAVMANGGDRNFWTLIETPPASDRMKQESKKYYPRMLAYILVNRDLDKYGFSRGTEPPDNVIQVPVEGMYPLARLDDALGYAPGTLARLNPDLLRDVTPPARVHEVSVPVNDRDRFLAALQSVPAVTPSAREVLAAAPATGARTHTVRRGESVAQIARKYGVSEKELMRVNKIKSPRNLMANQRLVIPGGGPARGGELQTAMTAPRPEKSAAASKPEKAPAAPPAVSATYKVKKGDTLGIIAKRHGVTPAELQQWNKLGKSTVIREGQSLVVGFAPAAAPAPEPVREKVRQHVVKPGEYPAVIARMYEISLDNLLQWNNLGRNSTIKAGDRLVVAMDAAPAGAVTASAEEQAPKASAQKQSASAEIITARHVVQRGETAGSIASRHGVPLNSLLADNNLTAKSVLKAGQELKVRKAAAGGAEKAPATARMTQAENTQGQKIAHKVAPGQNPTSIARQYGVRVDDIFKWNEWSKAPVLKVGDTVTVFRKP
ncbi:MAG: LysM peptidoglycan-binding domain-containing protein [Candidatus Hydrogenedentes bacterium]|nr:LysM peptidoglycan-binding domain-containing protein [Candidatus Hydrogenedentota bacterium]